MRAMNHAQQERPIMEAADAVRDTTEHTPQQTAVRMVKVYKFLIPNMGFCDNLAFNFYATREAILRFRGTVVADSAIEVAESEIDENGVYDPPRYAPQHNRRLDA
jgi:hypothetical protein